MRRAVEGRTHRLRLAPRALDPATDWLALQRGVWEGEFDAIAEHLKRSELGGCRAGLRRRRIGFRRIGVGVLTAMAVFARRVAHLVDVDVELVGRPRRDRRALLRSRRAVLPVRPGVRSTPSTSSATAARDHWALQRAGMGHLRSRAGRDRVPRSPPQHCGRDHSAEPSEGDVHQTLLRGSRRLAH